MAAGKVTDATIAARVGDAVTVAIREMLAAGVRPADLCLDIAEIRKEVATSVNLAYRDSAREVIASHGGNVTAAADELGVSRQWLHQTVKR